MRLPLALFGVSALLFVSGVGMVVMAARATRANAGAATVQAQATKPVATTIQIMRGIVDPAATVVFGAVSTTVTAAGVEDKGPSTQDEWNTVADSAAALAEAGNMLLAEGRAVDRDGWGKWSRALIESGSVALKAAEAKDASGVFASGEAIYESCDNCHRVYRRTE